MKTGYLLKRFIPYFKKYRWILILDLFCASLTTVCELVLPLIVRYLTELATNDFSKVTVGLVVGMGAVYLGLRVIDTAANYFMANVGHVMGAKIETDMRSDLFRHMQHLSHAYYSETKAGQLLARISSDLFDVTEFAHHCPEEFFIAALKMIVSFVILSSINVWLTLIIFAVIPVMVVCSIIINKKVRKAFKASRNQIGEINSQVEDNILGARVVKSFANEEKEVEKFEKGNHKFLSIKRQTYRYLAAFQSVTRAFDGLMYAILILAGGLFIIGGWITPADFTAYVLYVTTLLTTIRRIVEFAEQFQRGMTGIERFIEVLDAPVDIHDAPNAKDIETVKGNIVFEHVDFHYHDDPKNVLTDINLSVQPGESVALVGPSGSGKSTLCNLIPRFYDVTAGRITIDGQDIRSLTLHSLRSQIGVVQQDVYLFSGTVIDNIEYGRPGASRDDIIKAAKLAGAHDFIMELTDGYDTYVGEQGVKLSGGQKQRISIARVFLKNPPVLILDEATSALDNESEQIVQHSLETLAEGRTTFTIAHRLTTIRNASLILVLTENGIEEQGTHEELLKKHGIYYSLYSMYTDPLPDEKPASAK